MFPVQCACYQWIVCVPRAVNQSIIIIIITNITIATITAALAAPNGQDPGGFAHGDGGFPQAP